MARNYSFVRVDVPFGKNDVEIIAITNLRDGSSIVRVTLTRKVRAEPLRRTSSRRSSSATRSEMPTSR